MLASGCGHSRLLLVSKLYQCDTQDTMECCCKRRTILILSRTWVKCQCLIDLFSGLLTSHSAIVFRPVRRAHVIVWEVFVPLQAHKNLPHDQEKGWLVSQIY